MENDRIDSEIVFDEKTALHVRLTTFVVHIGIGGDSDDWKRPMPPAPSAHFDLIAGDCEAFVNTEAALRLV